MSLFLLQSLVYTTVFFLATNFSGLSSFWNENTSGRETDGRKLFMGSKNHRRREQQVSIDTNRYDMAVLIAYFNPIGYVRTTMNVLYVINKLRRDGYPLFVAEVSLQGKDYTLAPEQRQLSVKTDSVLFYKENIFNMYVPNSYQKEEHEEDEDSRVEVTRC